jgi:hypothetical protein
LNHYAGIPSRKATLGEPIAELDGRAYREIRILLYTVEAMFVAALCCWSWRK